MKKKPGSKLIWFSASPLVIIILLATALYFLNSGKIALGVKIANQKIGGLKQAPARQKIEEITNQLSDQTITLTYFDKNWTATTEQLGFVFDPERTLNNAYSLGRNKNFLINAAEQINLLLRPKHLSIYYLQNSEKLNDFIEKNLSAYERRAKNATLSYDPQTDDFFLVPSQDGVIFDRQDIIDQIQNQLAKGENKAVNLKSVAELSQVTQDIDNHAKIAAKDILRISPYQFFYGSSSWPIKKEIILEWLDFSSPNSKNRAMNVSLSKEEIKNYLAALTPAINKEPINANLTKDGDKIIEFTLAQNGVKLLIDESAVAISSQILKGKNEIALVVQEINPAISDQTIDTLGLVSLLGSGTSDYVGSPKNRVHNIEIGASKISGTLIKPGEEFSFVKAIGEIDATQGYLPELVIKNKKTVPEYGGGICQVSTTLFRAAVYGGLKITERYPHAFPVKYYSPQGFDATIYPPNPDLKFLNDTPKNILIQSRIENTKITFEIYGTSDGREARVVGPKILESNPDGSMKAVVTQEIWRDGVLENKKSFWSNYKSPTLYPTVKNPLE